MYRVKSLPAILLVVLFLFAAPKQGAAQKTSTLLKDLGIDKTRKIIPLDDSKEHFYALPDDGSYVVGFQVEIDGGQKAFVVIRREKGQNHDTQNDEKYYTVSCCVLAGGKCAKKDSFAAPLAALRVISAGKNVKDEDKRTVTLQRTRATPLANNNPPLPSVFTPTFSPTLVITVPEEELPEWKQKLAEWAKLPKSK